MATNRRIVVPSQHDWSHNLFLFPLPAPIPVSVRFLLLHLPDPQGSNNLVVQVILPIVSMKYVCINFYSASAVYLLVLFVCMCDVCTVCVLTHSVHCLSSGCYILYAFSVVVMCVFVYCVVYRHIESVYCVSTGLVVLFCCAFSCCRVAAV